MDKRYNPQDIEEAWYTLWEKAGYFKPSGTGKPYCIVIPPPNVTGRLHMGHGFQYTLMDILIWLRLAMGMQLARYGKKSAPHSSCCPPM